MLRLLLTLALFLPVSAPESTPPRQLHVWHASWCGPCQKMEPAVLRLQEEGLPIQWLDLDELPEPASKWGVSKVPTTILTVDGSEVRRLTGYQSENTLRSLLEDK